MIKSSLMGLAAPQTRGVYSSIIRPQTLGKNFSTLGKNSKFWKEKKRGGERKKIQRKSEKRKKMNM